MKAAVDTGIVISAPTPQSRKPANATSASTITSASVDYHCSCTTRRLTSIAVQNSIFLSITSGSANT
jgi:hypothetical protein